MLRRIVFVVAVASSLVGSIGTAFSLPFTLTFTASSFEPLFDNSPPSDSISGSLVFQAPFLTGPITGVDSINLTIAGHTYTVGEIGFDGSGGANLIGGLPSGANTVPSAGPDDFVLVWQQADSAFSFFSFHVTSNEENLFQTSAGSISITATPTAITSPPPLALLSVGVFAWGLYVHGRKSRKKFLQSES